MKMLRKKPPREREDCGLLLYGPPRFAAQIAGCTEGGRCSCYARESRAACVIKRAFALLMHT